MRASIVSLKFSPGHYSHVLAISKLLQSLGFEVLLVLDEEYRSFAAADSDERFLFTEGISALTQLCEFDPDMHIVFNLSTHDAVVISELRRCNPCLKAALVYHEPYRGLRETLGALLAGRRGLDHTMRILGRHAFSTNVLAQVDQVWLPSKSACAEYAAFDARYNESFHEFPLVFTDEAGQTGVDVPKEYFSFISTALPAKGFGEFLSCVKSMARMDSTMKFQIVTKTNISASIDNELRALQDAGRLIIEHGHPHSNEAINAAYARSLCTWFGYNASTQSGVLCKSFMFGSPGVATRVGAFEEYIDGTNSVFVEDNADVGEVYAAYQRIARGSENFVAAARETFLKHFYYANYAELMTELLASTGLATSLDGRSIANEDARGREGGQS